MDIITVQDVESGLGLSPGSLNEAKRGLISSVSAKLAIHCGRSYWGAKIERTEIHDGGRSFIDLKVWPVDTTASLNVYDDVLHEWGSDTIVDPDLYYVDADNGIISSEGWIFGTGTGHGRSLHVQPYNYKAIKVVYTAGYDQADVPQDLKRAALMQYEREYDVRYRSKGDADTPLGVLPAVKDILRKYTRRNLFA